MCVCVCKYNAFNNRLICRSRLTVLVISRTSICVYTSQVTDARHRRSGCRRRAFVQGDGGGFFYVFFCTYSSCPHATVIHTVLSIECTKILTLRSKDLWTSTCTIDTHRPSQRQTVFRGWRKTRLEMLISYIYNNILTFQKKTIWLIYLTRLYGKTLKNENGSIRRRKWKAL